MKSAIKHTIFTYIVLGLLSFIFFNFSVFDFIEDAFDDFSYLFGLNSRNLQINLTEGFGAGILFPKSNVKLLNKERYDDFNVAGWGASASLGLNITFLKHFFIQSDVKVGYINMTNVRTTKFKADSASQSFSFLENTLVFGGKFRLF